MRILSIFPPILSGEESSLSLIRNYSLCSEHEAETSGMSYNVRPTFSNLPVADPFHFRFDERNAAKDSTSL